MKKILTTLMLCLPMLAIAQNTLTPQQQLEQAQRQLEQAQAALEQAKANAAKAKAEAEQQARATAEARLKAEAEARAKTEAVQKKIAEAKAEAERLNREAARLTEEARKMTAPTTKAPVTPEDMQPSAAWTAPVTPSSAAKDANKPAASRDKDDKSFYMQPNAVPLINNQVIWSEDIQAPGNTANMLYDKAFAYLNELTQGNNQLDGSKVALVNKDEHSIIATMREKLVFSSNFLSLDFTQFNYVLQATCHDGHATLTMSRMTYSYDVQGNVTDYTAEKWITDQYALNKKHTRLLPVSGKFRRATIDRKDNIFNGFRQALK
ncbi:MAG: DUF4468 domain-containing protein [Prevotella sp.]|nr:DUF4468 domain-containing protein [Prevotella sp.]